MKIDFVTIFPRMFDPLLAEGVIARGIKQGLIDIRVWDLRDFTLDKHRSTDNEAYGGGPGMVMLAEPVLRCVERIAAEEGVSSIVWASQSNFRPDALDEEFMRWRGQAGLQGTPLRIFFSLSKDVVLSLGKADPKDSSYMNALREALNGTPPRPEDFQALLEVAAAVARFA